MELGCGNQPSVHLVLLTSSPPTCNSHVGGKGGFHENEDRVGYAFHVVTEDVGKEVARIRIISSSGQRLGIAGAMNSTS